MKSGFTSLLAASTVLLSTAPLANANDIAVYKCVYVEKTTSNSDVFSEALGRAPTSSTATFTYYLAIDLTAKQLVQVDYYRVGTQKEFFIIDADDSDSDPFTPSLLIDTFDNTQPVKGKVPSFLWSGVSPSIFKDSFDNLDDDSLPDLDYGTNLGMVTGVGVPFALGDVNRTVIPNVAPKISGTWLTTNADYMTGTLVDGNDTYVPAQAFEVKRATETITLDAVLTKAANLTDITPKTDVGLGAALLPKATLNNAIQRISEALLKLGYRLPVG